MKLYTRNLSEQKLNGPESKLVEKFLSNDGFFKEDGLEYTILTEAYAEVGIPDILILIWDKNGLSTWTEERHNLTKSDIKIMHHISTRGKRGEVLDNIIYQLGFSEKNARKTIQKLLLSDLILQKENGKIYSKDLDNSFFIRKIIPAAAIRATAVARTGSWRRVVA